MELAAGAASRPSSLKAIHRAVTVLAQGCLLSACKQSRGKCLRDVANQVVRALPAS